MRISQISKINSTMPVLSAQTLFHYTKKEYLLNILTQGLAPRYSKEFDRSLGEALTFGDSLYIPMVCFCDTPLSMIERHVEIYGSYGLGLSKEWGIRNRLNPVFYVKEGSLVHSNLIVPIQNLAIKAGTGKDDSLKKLVQELVFIYRYMKPYEPGRDGYIRRGKTYGDYRYYDEKEWRYVPDQLELDQQLSWTPTSAEIERANHQLQKLSLTFEARDISFIIINEERDIEDILQVLRASPMFNPEDQQYLLTTLLTTSTIRKNF